MKKAWKWVGIGFVVLIAAVMFYATLGLRDTLDLKIGTVDLASVPDGDYVGAYDCYRWTNVAKVSVRDHAITGIELVKGQSGREAVAQEMTRQILEVQSPALDAVSGATADKKAFLKAVENALQGAGG